MHDGSFHGSDKDGLRPVTGVCANRPSSPNAARSACGKGVCGSSPISATGLRAFAGFGYPVGRETFALRTDDLIAYWEAVRAGLGIGFLADYLARTDSQLVPILPMIKIRPLPIWLTVHREIRTSRRIRAVYDFLATAVPKAL